MKVKAQKQPKILDGYEEQGLALFQTAEFITVS